MDPTSLEEYRAHDGFVALQRTIEAGQPANIIDAVERSGLRGRGALVLHSLQPDDGGGDRALAVQPRLHLVGGEVFLQCGVELAGLLVLGERHVEIPALFQAAGLVIDDEAVEMQVRGAAGGLRMNTRGGEQSCKDQQEGVEQSFHVGRGFGGGKGGAILPPAGSFGNALGTQTAHGEWNQDESEKRNGSGPELAV